MKKQQKPKPLIQWNTITSDGLLCYGGSITREREISETVEALGMPWRKLYRRGYRIIRVEVRPL